MTLKVITTIPAILPTGRGLNVPCELDGGLVPRVSCVTVTVRAMRLGKELQHRVLKFLWLESDGVGARMTDR